MTQPDGLYPDGSFNLDSLAELAARPQSEWEAMIRGQSSNGFEMFLGALFGPLPADLREGIEFTRALVTAIIRQILNLPGQIWDSVEDALSALGAWVADIPIIGDILAIINDTFSALFGGVDFTDLPTPAEVWQQVINTLMLPLNLLLGPGSPLNAVNLFGRISLPQFGSGVPIMALTTAVPNELEPFTAESVPTSDGWSFNAVKDAAQLVCDGTPKALYLQSGVIKVEEGQPLDTSIDVTYSGVTSGAGQTIRLVLETFTTDNGSGTATPVTVGAVTNPAGTITTPVTLGDSSWDIPAGVKSVRPALQGDELITAGTVFWHNTPELYKKLAGPLAGGLPAAIQDRIDDFQGLLSDLLTNPAAVLGTITQAMVSGLGDLNTLTNQIRDILAGLVVTPINSTVAAIKDWFTGLGGKVQNLTSGGNLPQSAVSGLAGALDEFSDNFTELLNGVTTGSWNPASAINDLINSLFGTKQKTNQIVEDVQSGWEGTTPGGTPTQVYDTITEIKNAVGGTYTIEVKTTSGTWTNPGGIVEFWAICIGAGGGGGGGGKSTGSATAQGANGGGGGTYLAQQINPSDLGSTVDYVVPAGAAGSSPSGTASPSFPSVGSATSFGTFASSGSVQLGSIASMLGYYRADGSDAAGGGAGGNKTGGGTATSGAPGSITPLATTVANGGSAGGGNGAAGSSASLTGQTRCGGAGGGGGGGNGRTGSNGGTGGAGGFPGGGAGGGGAGNSTAGNTGGPGGNGGNGALVLLYR